MDTFVKSSPFDATVQELFAYHERPGAFLRLTPAWEPVELIEHTGGIQNGAKVELRLKIGPVPTYWRLIHENFVQDQNFEDVQVQGPFTAWRHKHIMAADGTNGSRLEDRIEYTLPLGILGKTFGGAFSRAKLKRLFAYRHEITRQDLATHRAYPTQPLKIAITGASGMMGKALVPFLTTGGHEVVKLSRRKGINPAWNPAELAGVDVVIHLAGESISEGRWTAAKKERILQSRIQGTRQLCETLAKMENPPKVLISSSAIGFYGERGDEVLTENSTSGDIFLSEVCRAWEAAAAPAVEKGIRVVNLRFGVVLSMSGGALAKMLLPFQLGVGGILGSGKQYMSWIALDDVVGAIYHAIMTPTLKGAVNVTAPHPVTNQEFTKTMGKVLFRPTLLPVPAAALRVVFGQLADELLLSSARVQPTRLTETGYRFRYEKLEQALRHVLGKNS